LRAIIYARNSTTCVRYTIHRAPCCRTPVTARHQGRGQQHGGVASHHFSGTSLRLVPHGSVRTHSPFSSLTG
jgi:hypothetical protein